MTSPDNAGIPAGAIGQPVSAWGDDAAFGEVTDALVDGFPQMIQFFIALALKALGDLVGGIPFIGDGLEDILDGIADHLIGTRQTAVAAQNSADVAYTNAGVAYSTATAAQATASAAQTAASGAVSAASAAANAAAAAQETADVAYGLSSYWEAECVVSSAEVLLGVNELLIGLCQNEPDDCNRFVTDIHLALKTNPGGAVIQTRKWNAAGTSDSLIHTATLGANVTRANYSTLNLQMADKERVFWNVTTATPGGSPLAPPTVLQCLLFGVIIGE